MEDPGAPEQMRLFFQIQGSSPRQAFCLPVTCYKDHRWRLAEVGPCSREGVVSPGKPKLGAPNSFWHVLFRSQGARDPWALAEQGVGGTEQEVGWSRRAAGGHPGCREHRTRNLRGRACRDCDWVAGTGVALEVEIHICTAW